MATENPAAKSKQLTNVEAFLHIFKATIGGGFLAMPEAFHNAGIIVGTIGITILGLSVLNMMSFLVRCSQTLRSRKYAAIITADRNRRGKGDGVDAKIPDGPSDELLLPPMEYPETVEAVFRYGAKGRFAWMAPTVRNFTSTILLITYYGVNIIYVCIIASTLKQLVDQYTLIDDPLHDLSIRYYPALMAIAIIPIGMVSNLKVLVYFSQAANILICSGAIIIVGLLSVADSTSGELGPKMIVWPMARWSLFAGTTLCSLEGIGMLMKIENSMIRPKELAGPPAYTLQISMVLIVLCNGLLGLLGYVRFGDTVLGSISLNLPTNNWLADLVKSTIGLGILLTYGLQLNVTADLLFARTLRLVNRLKPGLLDMKLKLSITTKLTADQIANPHHVIQMKRLKCVYFIMRFALIVGSIIVATIAPTIGPLISLVGAVGFSVLGLMIPAFAETVWYWNHGEIDRLENNDNQNKAIAEEPEQQANDLLESWNVDGPPHTLGMSTFWAAVGSFSMVVTNSRTGVTAKTTAKNRALKRVMRHLKNVIIVALGMFALVGGVVYNVQQVIAVVPNDS